MKWIMNVFGTNRTAGPGRLEPARAPSRVTDLERALERGARMLQTLAEAYGADSLITRQQSSYVETLRRDLSAARTATA